MAELLKETFEFLSNYLTPQGMAATLLAIALVYVWFLYHRQKLLEERLHLMAERRLTAVQELEQLSKSPLKQEGYVTEKRHDAETRSILVADDEILIRDILAQLIKKDLGIEAVKAANGIDVLKQIDANQPSLLILDLLMPGKTGWEVLAEITRRRYEFPVLVISAYVSSKEQVAKHAGIKAGRIEFLEKPFDLAEFTSAVKKLLGSK